MRDKPVCFISYSRKDLKKARRICSELAKANIEVRFDQNDIVGGESWKHALYDLIRGADVLVFLMTANSIQSQWCLVERCLAEYDNKVVITVMMENCTPPSDVQHLHYINLSLNASANMPSLISAVFAGANRVSLENALQLPTNSAPNFNTTGTAGDVINSAIGTANDVQIGRKVVKD